MKIWVASAGALLLLSACGASKDATAALEAMGLGTGKSSELLQYGGKSGSGDDITLTGVTIGPAADGLKAASVKLGGLDMVDGKPVVTSIIMTDLAPVKAEAGMKLVLKNVSIEGMNPATGQFVAANFKSGPGAEPPPLEKWGFSKISVNGMTLAVDGAAMGVPGKVNVGLDEFSVSNLKDSVFGAARLSGLKGDFNVPPEVGGMEIAGTFDFGTAEFKNIRGNVYAAMADAAMMSIMGGGSMGTALNGLSSPLESGYDSFNWSGMNIDASGLTLAVSKVEQTVTRDAKGIATAVSMPKATMTLTADAAKGGLGASASTMLAGIGYPVKSIELYAAGGATFDPATDTTRVANYAVGITDTLDVKLEGGFQGVRQAMSAMLSAFSPMGIGGDPTAPPAGPEAAKIVDLDLTISDKKLMPLILNLQAMGTGQSIEEVRADVVKQAAAWVDDIPQLDKGVGAELKAAVAGFLKQPGTLNIKLKPAAPVSLATEPNAKPANKAALGFSATFTPGPAN